jgi:itaconyl-CoA hydratase
MDWHGLFFEDFAAGDIFEHSRGRTVTHYDNYAITHLSMNTAEAHFNLVYSQALMDGSLRERIVAGPCTIGIVIGLTNQDMGENAFADIGMTALKLHRPVFADDTLHARSEVLEIRDDPERSDAGIVRYRFVGTNQDGNTVAEGERTLLVKKRTAWEGRDMAIWEQAQ